MGLDDKAAFVNALQTSAHHISLPLTPLLPIFTVFGHERHLTCVFCINYGLSDFRYLSDYQKQAILAEQ